MSTKTWPTLLERLREGGDVLAWEEFFRRYWRLIFTAARRRGCSDDTAEDIVQEVMMAVFERRQVFRYDAKRGRFRDWLGALVRNKVADRRRRPSERIHRQVAEPEEDFTGPAADDPLPEDIWDAAFEESLLIVLLEEVRHGVDPRTYQAFELFALQGIPAREVARTAGLTRNAVYQARKNVVRRLKQLGATYRDDGRLTEKLKQALYEGRLRMYEYQPFIDEALSLEYDTAKGKVDHPLAGSKDVTDAVAGVLEGLAKRATQRPMPITVGAVTEDEVDQDADGTWVLSGGMKPVESKGSTQLPPMPFTTG